MSASIFIGGGGGGPAGPAGPTGATGDTGPTGPAGVGSGASIFWDFDGGMTWADVMAIVAAGPGPFTITVTGTNPVITPGTWDMKGSVLLAATPLVPTDHPTMDPGAVLHELRGISGLTLVANAIGGPCLTFDYSTGFAFFYLNDNGSINGENAAAAVTAVPDGQLLFVTATNTGGYAAQAANYYFASLGSGSFLVWALLGAMVGNFPTYLVEGPADSFFITDQVAWDFPFTLPPGFLGTYYNAPFNKDAGVGPTSQRPTVLAQAGDRYFDTDLGAFGLPIWFNTNNQWIYADGTLA